MSVSRLFSIILLLAVLSGCASNFPKPDFTIADSARIGYFVELDRHPVHSHVGTTVFNNFTTTYEDEDWPLAELARQTLVDQLSLEGMIPVDLAGLGFELSDFNGLVRRNGQQWQAGPGKEETLNRLKLEQQLAAIVVVRPLGRHVVSLECSNLGCNNRWADGMGLFTRGFMGLLSFEAVPGMDLSIVVFDPLFDLALHRPLLDYRTVNGNSVALRQVPRPDEFRELQTEDLLPVRAAIEQRIEEIMHKTALALVGRGDD
ncbi:MAG: hypothetical protein ACXIUM_13110 [Wenzhouxiangella sp.]